MHFQVHLIDLKHKFLLFLRLTKWEQLRLENLANVKLKNLKLLNIQNYLQSSNWLHNNKGYEI